MSDVILVHGLWHQGAHMNPLANELRSRGHRVQMPDLHRGSLAGDTALVQTLVDECETPPLVLGHSYGGSVITGLRGIRSFIFLAAYVPDAGESCASLGGALVDGVMIRHPEGGTFLDAQAATTALYADSPPATAQWAASLLVRQAPGHGRGIPVHIGWRTVPSLYIVCDLDRAVDPAVQRVMALRCTRSTTLSADHSPYISQPGVIADLIEQELSHSSYDEA